jgi:hypothetical protein
MSGYSRFDRHEHMDRDTLFEIGDIIGEVRWDSSFNLTNQLYGLYDGYLYDELLINAQDLPKDLFRRIIKVWAVVSKYPTIQYVAGIDEPVVEADEVEYRTGMGVADGKLYLATN